ncbi:hypothetical protein AB0I28_34620 [Phytomonospora sp. NPDC050363]|uniref:TlpA family protein disulfide reductase n=1 Tax=Phytomonospora sp. NPDC050363 TaxID=3155642 RepID=UPI0033F7239B
MALLASLTVLATLLGLLNLLLTVALVKRVREHDAKFAAFEVKTVALAEVGERVDDFEAATVDGEILTRDALPEGTLVGFFDPQCETCAEELPKWSAVAAALPLGRKQALAVVREAPDQEEMIAVASPHAHVVVERRRGPVARAFRVKATPAFCVLGAGQVVVSHEFRDGD